MHFFSPFLHCGTFCRAEGLAVDCLLFRHGIAVEPDEWDGAEARRPLTEKGKRRVRQAADGLAAMDIAPTHLLCSPFTRAQMTARIIRSRLCRSVTLETADALAVGSTPEQLLARLSAMPLDAVVLCVGHEPLLGDIAAVLLCGRAEAGFALKKAGAALIHLPDGVAAGRGLLRWWLLPAHLRSLRKNGNAGRKGANGADD